MTLIPYYDAGGITIYHGDYRDVLPALDLARLDLVLTDPPYGIGVTRMTLGNGRRCIERGDAHWDDAPVDLGPLLALGVPSVIWGGNFYTLPPARCWLVWDKGTGANDYGDCELAWTNLNSVIKRYFRSWVGANAREPVERYRWHPTQKPVDLMRWCLGFVPAARTVLDPFMGSGTTLRAARDVGRHAIGIEIEERYCAMAVRRLAQQAMQFEAVTA